MMITYNWNFCRAYCYKWSSTSDFCKYDWVYTCLSSWSGQNMQSVIFLFVYEQNLTLLSLNIHWECSSSSRTLN
jgi:hypothetical protein